MDHFSYKNNHLHAEGVAVRKIAEKVGTPFYCYSTATLTRHFNVFVDAFRPHKVMACYAVKANSSLAVIKTLGELGAGADVVSQGEIMRALASGIPASRIVFSGVGKTREEMAFALKKKIFQFNVESEEELLALQQVAKSLNAKADIAIRVNPDVDSKTHKKITTGKKENKFGVDWDQAIGIYDKAKKLTAIRVRGVSTHIGSQVTELAPFNKAFLKVKGLIEELRSRGHKIERMDLGGGLGIPYGGIEKPPSPKEYADMIKGIIKGFDCQLVFEPGRVIVGNAGIMVSEVIYKKDTGHKKFLIVDAGMNDLIRPSFYEAFHEIIPVQKSSMAKEKVDVVGPVCETGDVFATERLLPALKEGDLIAFRTAGAYGAVMASTYNSRLMIPEVIVKGSNFFVSKPRQTYEEMLEAEKIPNWFKK